MAIPNGVDVYLQISQALLDVNVHQQFDVDFEGMGAGPDDWHIESEAPFVKVRATEDPFFSLLPPANAEVLFSGAEFLTSVSIEGSELDGLPTPLANALSDTTIDVTAFGTCAMVVNTGLTVSERPPLPEDEAGKVYLTVTMVDGEADVTVHDFEIQSMTFNPEPNLPGALTVDDVRNLLSNSEALKSRIGDQINERLASAPILLDPRDISSVGLNDVGIPAAAFNLAVADSVLQVFATKDGATPNAIPALSYTNDFVMALGGQLMAETIQNKVNETVVNAPPTKLNDNYSLKIKGLSTTLVEGGFQLTGTAEAEGKPNDWWEVFDWYPDVDITIHKLVYSFKGISLPGGSFAFEKTDEDIEKSKGDMAWLVISGILTLGLTWGANPLASTLGLGIGGYIHGGIQLGKLDANQPSIMEMSPDGFAGEAAGVQIQIVDLDIDEASFVVLADMVADMAFRRASLGGVTAIRAADEVEPAELPTSVAIPIANRGFWEGDRRNEFVWRINGGQTYKGPLTGQPTQTLGPINSGDAGTHGGVATVTCRILRRDRNGVSNIARSMRKVVSVVGPFGVVVDAFFLNTKRSRLHVAPGSGRCWQSAKGSPKNRQMGWPTKAEAAYFMTCPDCFGLQVPVASVWKKLQGLEADWKDGTLESWLLNTPKAPHALPDLGFEAPGESPPPSSGAPGDVTAPDTTPRPPSAGAADDIATATSSRPPSSTGEAKGPESTQPSSSTLKGSTLAPSLGTTTSTTRSQAKAAGPNPSKTPQS